MIVIIVIGAYFFLSAPASAPAPAGATPTPSSTNTPAPTATTPPQNVGAAGVSDPNAPPGSPEECAKCDEYQGAQKAQCLVALNCQ